MCPLRITVDPETDVSGFGYAEAGRYRLRVISVSQEEGPKAPYLKWELEFSDPNVRPVEADKKRVGHIFENTTLKKGENAQFRLRQLVEALGETWGDFDAEYMIGREFEAEVCIDEYEGRFSNKIEKYIASH